MSLLAGILNYPFFIHLTDLLERCQHVFMPEPMPLNPTLSGE